nr:DUF397 domain-containing protein [Kibdelosporangium sp. MJ126-NF4]CEL22669.1 hypothetical protein [Kibdelosporangium sp. MJ126-NF4]CTQ89810.1 hypothetical protein [Kibdelosporangium sp. MJ126-NF4]
MEWRKSSYSGNTNNCVEVSWRKSSRSLSSGNCVEVKWRKSSGSGNTNACVEVANTGPVVGVRDSKNPAPTLAFDQTAWSALVSTLAPSQADNCQ